MTIWLHSDPHFFHDNMYVFTKADGTRVRHEFANAAEGDAAMVEHWNAVVKPEDHVWCLGDWTLLRSGGDIWKVEKLTKSLHGHKRLLLGNHDHYDVRVYRDIGFEKVQAYHKMDNLWLSHIPLHPDNLPPWCACNVHGHIHANPSPVGRYLNVCVEVTGYAPISLEEVKASVQYLQD